MTQIEGELLGTITLLELCSYTQLPRQDVVAMIEIGLIEPIEIAVTSDKYRFATRDLRRARVANRLMRDTGVNLDGVAMIMDLLEERDALLNRISVLEKSLER